MMQQQQQQHNPVTIWSSSSSSSSTLEDSNDDEHVLALEYTVGQARVGASDLGSVLSNGDCMFLALSRSIQVQLDLDLSSKKLRKLAIRAFAHEHRDHHHAQQRVTIETQIQHFYFPDLSTGWSIQPVKTHYYLLPLHDDCSIDEEVLELIELGMDETSAKVHVYQDYAYPVKCLATYLEFMALRGPKKNGNKKSNTPMRQEYRSIAIHYDAPDHCLYVDDHVQSITWGDDLMLEALATVIQRPIVVVMMCANGQFLHLEHRPYGAKAASVFAQEDQDQVMLHPESDDGAESYGASYYDELVPIVLKMKCDGSKSNGGDHYEPMRAFLIEH